MQHVLDFLIEATAPAVDRNGVASPQPATAGAPVMPSGVAAMPELAGPAGSAAVASRNGHAATEPAATEAGTGRSVAELSAFLVNFVVEQTGYPPEIVELDADLEADLGIDSIKKAQLFGEIGEYFAIPPRADLALDDFPTLRHVLDFLVEATSR